VINDAGKPGYGRVCGHHGGGAVIRSKNLKAIAVRGTLDIGVANPEFAKLAQVPFTFDV
jgi:aldehyde:ferredoxin oxidoreductase